MPSQEPSRRVSLSLRVRLAFLALGLTAITLTGGVAFWIAERALEAATYERLTGIRETKKRQLEAYLNDALNIVAALGRDESAVDRLMGFEATWPPDGADYRAVAELHDEGLAGMTAALGFEDLLLITRANLRVVYTASGAEEIGANLGDAPLRETELGEAVAAVLADPTVPRLADYAVYPTSDKLVAFAVAAIRDNNGC